jgi:hypothetical protein
MARQGLSAPHHLACTWGRGEGVEMSQAKLFVLCVVAICGVGAGASASASASLPEYRFCVKTAPARTGEYTDKSCATHGGTPGRGIWELESFEHTLKRTFKGMFGATKQDVYVPESEAEPWTGGTSVGAVTCAGGSSKGEITGLKTSVETRTFVGCQSEGRSCNSAGQKKGTVVTNALAGELGYTPGGGVGTRLSPVTGEVLAEYACQGLDFVTRGSVIGADSGDLNKARKEVTLTYAVNTKGGQQVAFGEFPAGGGPFFEQSLVSPPGSNYPEGLTTVVSYKERAPAVEIDA